MCRVVSGPAIRQRRVTYRMGKEPLARRWLWVYAREIAYLVPVAVRFGNDLPQTLDEPARCHSEVHKNLLPGGAPVWCPPPGEVDEELRIVVRMYTLAVDFDPGGMTPLTPLAIFCRVHGIQHIYSGLGRPVELRICLTAARYACGR